MRRQWKLRGVSVGGFTLIELMIGVGIAGILAAVAYASYTNQVRKSRRTEAKTALLDFAGREERYLTTNLAYTNSFPALGYSGATSPMPVGSGAYQLTVVVGAGPPATFTVTATPQGAQTKDTECGNFVLDQLGQQTVSGTGTKCW